MEIERKFLYFFGKFSRDLYRAQIVRETNCYLITSRGTKISKKKMTSGNDIWRSTHYYLETPELLETYKRHRLNRKFIKQLDIIREKCKNVKDIDCVSDRFKKEVCNLIINGEDYGK